MGIVEVWSVIAVVLHFVGIGSFAEWPLIAWPTQWSCLCLEIWMFIFYIVIVVICAAIGLFTARK